jgi:hypothetical protein
LPLSSPAWEHAWRRLAKWFCGNGFAWAVDAAPFSSSVPTVIAGSAIAAWPAAIKPGCGSGAVPIAGTNGVWKDASIIGTASGNIAGGRRKRA